MVKFGDQLEIGQHGPWREYYLNYIKLKRLIERRKFVLDKLKDEQVEPKRSTSIAYMANLVAKSVESNRIDVVMSDEKTPLNSSNGSGYEIEMSSMSETYQSTAIDVSSSDNEITDDSIDFFSLIKQEIDKINKFFVGKLAELQSKVDVITNERKNAYRSHHTSGRNINLNKIRDLYVEIFSLKTFAELNYTAFYKIIKKYDKTMGEKNLEVWMNHISAQIFTVSKEPGVLIEIIQSLVSRDKLLEWDKYAIEQQDNESGSLLFPGVRWHGIVISGLLFILSKNFSFIPATSDPAASRCLSLLLLVVSLWITEAIPYFATALLIPPLVVFMGVLKDTTQPTGLMKVSAAAQFVTDHIFNHTTMLLLGGYTISGSFSRCQLELRIASYLQEILGTRPQLFILAIMFVGLILSMWINNHTAPILCSAIILPIVKDLPLNSRYSKALLIGLAVACNFGGMMTPISSLQNVLAVSCLTNAGVKVSFGQWMAVALPFCLINLVIAWLLILFIIKPNDLVAIPIVTYNTNNSFSKKNTLLLALCILTILLFSTSSFTNEIFGDISIISLLFVGIIFGTGMLTEVDFNSMSWHTLFLVGGGNVLGKAIESSGLLEYLSNGIIAILPLDKPWFALLYILFFCGVIATFVSHTVASIILLPVISSIGVQAGLPEVVTIGSAFAISAAMALPFSSFPNVNSLLIVDDFRRPYLSVNDFVKMGLPMSVVAILLIATIGSWLIAMVCTAPIL